jgi:hypothetical protein
MPQTLSDADCAELAGLLRKLIDADRFPLSPRVRRWKELLSKLDPAKTPVVEPYPPPRPLVNSSIGQRKRRR